MNEDTLTMIPDELVKAVPEVAKGLAAVGASIPTTAMVKRMLGPAMDEVAEMLRDRVRLYRYGRQLTCVEKAAKMAEEAGFQPCAVPPKILFPLLEGVSWEEDEEMHTMWASLLANATNSASTNNVRPSFIAILKQLAPDEARLLNWFYAEVTVRGEAIPRLSAEFKFDELSAAYKSLQNDAVLGDEFVICLSNLEAADLIARMDHYVNNEILPRYVSRPRGVALYRACRPPQNGSRNTAGATS
jgi:hypothetical protein